jgi:heme A synthase
MTVRKFLPRSIFTAATDAGSGALLTTGGPVTVTGPPLFQ